MECMASALVEQFLTLLGILHEHKVGRLRYARRLLLLGFIRDSGWINGNIWEANQRVVMKIAVGLISVEERLSAHELLHIHFRFISGQILGWLNIIFTLDIFYTLDFFFFETHFTIYSCELINTRDLGLLWLNVIVAEITLLLNIRDTNYIFREHLVQEFE